MSASTEDVKSIMREMAAELRFRAQDLHKSYLNNSLGISRQERCQIEGDRLFELAHKAIMIADGLDLPDCSCRAPSCAHDECTCHLGHPPCGYCTQDVAP